MSDFKVYKDAVDLPDATTLGTAHKLRDEIGSMCDAKLSYGKLAFRLTFDEGEDLWDIRLVLDDIERIFAFNGIRYVADKSRLKSPHSLRSVG